MAADEKLSDSGGYTLQEAREERGWSYHEVAKRTGLTASSVRHAEMHPESVASANAWTVIQLVRVFWPDVQLTDLIPDSPFRLEPRTYQMRARLERAAFGDEEE